MRTARVGRLFAADNPATVKWLGEHGVDVDDLDDPVVAAPRASAEIASTLGDRATVSLDSIMSLNLAELTEKFGTAPEFLTFTKARKELAAAMRQEHLLEQLKGTLIGREFVRVHIFGALDTLCRLLLFDTPKNLSATIAARVHAGETNEQLARRIQDHIGAQIKRLKSEMIRKLEAQPQELQNA